jgi:preprotein translocase subunit SecD
MNARIRNRLLVTAGITILSVLLFAGFPPTPPPGQASHNWFGVATIKEKIRLGLDLQGGIRLVLKVITDDAIRAETDQTIESVRNQMTTERHIPYRQIARSPNLVSQFQVVGVDPAKGMDFEQLIMDLHPEWDIVSRAGEVPNTYTLQLKAQQIQLHRDQAVDQAINTIRNRVDQLGVTEPIIQRYGGQGEYEILVQFPGEQDPGRVQNIIQRTALLELKLVDGSNSYPSQAAAVQQRGGVLPPDLDVLPSSSRAGEGGSSFYVVHRGAVITGRDLKNAYVSRDENGRPAVSFTLTADGAQRFGRATEQNIGQLLAIVLDGRIVSAPRINSRISDSGQITGGPSGFPQKDADDLALVLKSGALPASMVTEDEEVVGPLLGADSIRKGEAAAIAALLFVVAFMLIYYRGAGINATVAMVLNIIILFGAMAYFGATLTLPGIAGVILTIGVGIDSNVLIFERIREELRAGKAAASAVVTSFNRVFITLVDTHLAALISATFLFLFGTGPVKGFAVTLVIGLVSNMFTAVFVSRTLFELVLARKERAETISI